MSAAGVDANGAVVVPAPASAPANANPDPSSIARPVMPGVETHVPSPSAQAQAEANPSPPVVAAAVVVLPSSQTSDPVAPAPAATSAPAPVDSPSPSSPPVQPSATAPAQPEAVPPDNPPAPAASEPAALAADPPVPVVAPPVQEPPAQPSASAPAPNPSTPADPVAPAEPSSQAEAINGANVFAPEVEVADKQEEPAPTSENTPPVVAETPVNNVAVAAPSPSPSDTATGTGGSSQQASTSTQSSVSSTSSSTSIPGSSSKTSASSLSDKSNATSGASTGPAPSENGNAVATPDPVQTTEVKTEIADPTEPPPPSSVEETTFVSGSSTLTGTAALAAASAAKTESGTKSKDKDGLSSFAIIGIVGGILVFFILGYIAWFQWRKRRARKDLERIDDLDGGFSPTSTAFDPYNLDNEKQKYKHSGFDFIDQPLSSWRSQKSRHESPGVGPAMDPFTDHHAERASPGRNRNGAGDGDNENDAHYQRRLETEYTETWYSDPGGAGLGTASAISATRPRSWFGPETAAMTDGGGPFGDRRPSYIDGPQSIYHETNDPTNPNAHMWTEVSPSARSPQTAKSTASNRVPAPPVPPLPAAYQSQSQSPKSSAAKKDARPETDFSCGDFYQGYDHSRPGTEYTQYTPHDQAPETSFTGMHTPATSTMLPWLSEKDAPPPIPVKGPVNPTTLPNQPQRKETGGFGFGSSVKAPLRSPPSAAMAQKPNVQSKGWLGVIPTFR